MSRRLRGLKPEYSELPNKTRKLTPKLPQTISVQSAPPLLLSASSESQINSETKLTKDEILRILSKEMPMDKASLTGKFINTNGIENIKVASIYSSYFFRKDIIKQFQKEVINQIPSDKINNFPLSSYNLYNKDDILNNTTYRPDKLGNRIIEKNNPSYSRTVQTNMRKFITFLTNKICTNINTIYARNSLNRAIDLVKNENTFDILIASTKTIEDVTLSIEDRLKGVVAIIIVELGECKKYLNAYSINLICTTTKDNIKDNIKKAISGTGSLLMGAFLYTILSHPDIEKCPTCNIDYFPPGNSFLNVTSKKLSNGEIIENCTFGTNEPLIPIQHTAVLELAHAYKNVVGLCMYEKFGFLYDSKLFSNKNTQCFNDRDNLPMLIDFNSRDGYSNLTSDEKKQKIVQIICNLDKGFQKSKICYIRDTNQKLLGILKSIKIHLDNTENISIDYFKNNNISPEYDIINILHNSGGQPTIEEVINFLENPPQKLTPLDVEVNKIIENLKNYLDKKQSNI